MSEYSDYLRWMRWYTLRRRVIDAWDRHAHAARLQRAYRVSQQFVHRYMLQEVRLTQQVHDLTRQLQAAKQENMALIIQVDMAQRLWEVRQS